MAWAQPQVVPAELQDFQDTDEVMVLLVGMNFFRRLAETAAAERRRPAELLELILEEHLRNSLPGHRGETQ